MNLNRDVWGISAKALADNLYARSIIAAEKQLRHRSEDGLAARECLTGRHFAVKIG
jgi:hypothetical protein